jgi:hypothetical protein
MGQLAGKIQKNLSVIPDRDRESRGCETKQELTINTVKLHNINLNN